MINTRHIPSSVGWRIHSINMHTFLQPLNVHLINIIWVFVDRSIVLPTTTTMWICLIARVRCDVARRSNEVVWSEYFLIWLCLVVLFRAMIDRALIINVRHSGYGAAKLHQHVPSIHKYAPIRFDFIYTVCVHTRWCTTRAILMGISVEFN